MLINLRLSFSKSCVYWRCRGSDIKRTSKTWVVVMIQFVLKERMVRSLNVRRSYLIRSLNEQK